MLSHAFPWHVMILAAGCSTKCCGTFQNACNGASHVSSTPLLQRQLAGMADRLHACFTCLDDLAGAAIQLVDCSGGDTINEDTGIASEQPFPPFDVHSSMCSFIRKTDAIKSQRTTCSWAFTCFAARSACMKFENDSFMIRQSTNQVVILHARQQLVLPGLCARDR